MPHLNNSALASYFNKVCSFKGDGMLSDINPIYQPVILSMPVIDFFKNTERLTTGTGTVYTVPAGKRLLIYTIGYSLATNAACDNTKGQIQLDSGGSGHSLIVFRKITLTSFVNSKILTFPYPLILNQGDKIEIYSSFTVGSCIQHCWLYGNLTEA